VSDLKIVKVAINSLTLDDNNARTHSEKNIESITRSLDKFGQQKPIVVHKDIVIAGNGTVLAAQKLGWTEIQIVKAPDSWDSETVKAYALADNRTAELAAWDEEILLETLTSLSDAMLEAAGFTDMDIRALEAIYGEIPEGFEGRPEPKVEIDGKLISLHVEDETFDRWKETWESLHGNDDQRVNAILDVMP
jgi:ParB-like chromosome segregation protein Spo0J